MWRRSFTACLGWCYAASLGAAEPGFREAEFRQIVAPIFEQHCVQCHQPGNPKAGLALTSRFSALAGGQSGPAFVPGDADESLLVQYISGDDPLMPKEGPPLEAEQVEIIRRWVAGGAAWPDDVTLSDKRLEGQPWWSLEPLVKPPLPDIEAHPAAPLRTAIDAFVQARLRAEGLQPSPQADRRTLIRRLSYDLHGLPPTPDEMQAFLCDPASDAYERLVDRLLASPRYGERWARHWLDVVHYGETHGYDKDKPRPHAWPYRDYVIRSLNEDKPYSRFVREQIAGDVLYPDDPQAVVATGLIVAGPWDFVGHVELREGTKDKLIARLNDRDDMVMTIVSTFLSLTAHCARCHDHKFDPIPQVDYYRLQAVFAGVDRADRPYDPDPGVHRRRAALLPARWSLEKRRSAVEVAIAAVNDAQLSDFQSRLAGLESRLKTLEADAAVASPTNGYHSRILPEQMATRWVQVDLGKSIPIDEIRLIPARPVDFPDTPGFGFPLRFSVAVSDDPDFSTRRNVAETATDVASPGNSPFIIPLQGVSGRYVRVTATKLWKRTDDYILALGELDVRSHGINAARGQPVAALDSIEAGRWSAAYLVDGYDSRKRLEKPEDDDALRAQRHEIETEFGSVQDQREERLQAILDPAVLAERQLVDRELGRVDEELSQLPPPRLVYAAAREFRPQANFIPAIAPRPVYLLRRGDVEDPGEPVSPGALSCVVGLEHEFALPDPEDEGSRRAALAHWITDPRNVLTPRSIVNRVWHYHFGRGIVDTPNDFGRMGSIPTHPELLDRLAVEFREHGESLKWLHRQIVTSSVYRQSSRSRPDAERVDAGNRYLWRMNRSRLDAECIRDAALFVSGKLDQAMGGPSVQQFEFKDDHSPVYDYEAFEVNAPESFRRSVYRFVVRSVPDPFMDCLDCADPSILTPKRNTTITALQALAMLNNRFMVSQAEHFASRLEALSEETEGRIHDAFLLALGRPPGAEESRLLVSYAARYGLANTCRLLLNSNEFMFID